MPFPSVERRYNAGVIRKQRIADRAYQKWREAGRPEGRDVEFWLSAESEIDEANALSDMKRVRTCHEEFDKHVDMVIETTAKVNEILKS